MEFLVKMDNTEKIRADKQKAYLSLIEELLGFFSYKGKLETKQYPMSYSHTIECFIFVRYPKKGQWNKIFRRKYIVPFVCIEAHYTFNGIGHVCISVDASSFNIQILCAKYVKYFPITIKDDPEITMPKY